MKARIVLTAIALSTALAATANPDAENSPSATENLLAAQRSGELESTNEQYLSGSARSEIYQRYVKSFSYAIPETYIDDSFKGE